MAKQKIETIGELRTALTKISDDTPIQFLFDGADYRAANVEHFYPGDRESFVRFTLCDD